MAYSIFNSHIIFLLLFQELKTSMKMLNEKITFLSGHQMKNRFMLAPLTNTQSHEDGVLSDDEYYWLTKRAQGGFGITMSCASHVQDIGKGFPGQLGIFDDKHIKGLTKLTTEIKEHHSLAIAQLHHAGMRSPEELIDTQPVCPSDDSNTGARALTFDEVIQLRNDFISAAVRAQKSGYQGVEIHGAHGYILSQFLSSEINRRMDDYGGSIENRSRIIFEIVDGVRNECGKDFILGVRLSPEGFGLKLAEIKEVCESLIATKKIDFLDISLWDSFKEPNEEEHKQKSLLKHFTDLDFMETLLTVAGNIRTGKDVSKILESGVDFVTIGRGGILHHDFPKKVIEDPDFEPIKLPVSKQHLVNEGLSDKFIKYMQRWQGFVEE